MTPTSIYLILIIHGQAIWGLPAPYPSQADCDEAGARWDSGGPPEPGARGHYCLPAAIVAPPLPPYIPVPVCPAVSSPAVSTCIPDPKRCKVSKISDGAVSMVCE